MLSKNNFQERLRRMERKQERFSIRKLTIGTASVLIGISFFAVNQPDSARAATVVKPDSVVVENNDDGSSAANSPTSTSEVTLRTSSAESNSASSASNEELETVKGKAEDLTTTSAASDQKSTVDSSASSSQSMAASSSSSASSDASSESKATSDASSVSASSSVSSSSAANNSVAEAEKKVNSASSEDTDSSANLSSVDTTTLSVADSGNARMYTNGLATVADSKVTTNTNGQSSASTAANVAAQAEIEKTAAAADDPSVATVSDFAGLSKAIMDKNITTINLTSDIDLSGVTKVSELKVDGGLTTHSSLLSTNYELSADASDISRTLTINGNGHTLDMGKWYISFEKDSVGDNQWDLTLKNLTLKNTGTTSGAITSTDYTPIYFGDVGKSNLPNTNLTFEDVTAKLNTVLVNDGEPVNVIFKGTDVIKIAPLANNATGSVLLGANRNMIYANSVYIADNANVSITGSMTGNLITGSKLATDEGHNVIRLDNSNSSNAGNMTVGKNATLNIDTTASTVSVRGIASRNTDGTLNLEEGATVNMNMGIGYSSAVLLSNLILDKDSTLYIKTQQDNAGVQPNVGQNGYLYAPIGLGVIALSQPSTATLKVSEGATLKVVRGSVSSTTPLIAMGQSNPVGLGSYPYTIEFDDGSTVDLQDGNTKYGGLGTGLATKKAYSAFIYLSYSNTAVKIGQMKYLNLQRTGSALGQFIDANDGTSVDAGKYGGIEVEIWNKDNTTDTPDSTYQVQSFTANSNGKITSATMAANETASSRALINALNLMSTTNQRLVLTAENLETYKYDASYENTTAKIGETTTVAAPTFTENGSAATTQPKLASDGAYSIGWNENDGTAISGMAVQGATIDSSTGEITFTPNEGQVGTLVNVPVTITYADGSVDRVIAPIYVSGDNYSAIWQSDDGKTTGLVSVHYDSDDLPETSNVSVEVPSAASNTTVTYYNVPSFEDEVYKTTATDITDSSTVDWEDKEPSTIVDEASTSATTSAPLTVTFNSNTTAVQRGLVEAGSQTTTMTVGLVGAQAATTTPNFTKEAIDSGLTQTQFKKLVDTSALDNAGISYTLSWDEDPTTTNGTNTGTVRVTYSDVTASTNQKARSVENSVYLVVPVTYNVTDVTTDADTYNTSYSTTVVKAGSEATITPALTDSDGNTVDIPEGTKFTTTDTSATVDETTGVVTVPASDDTTVTTVPVTVTYPDGSATTVNATAVSVALNDNVVDPTSPYDMIKDASNLPSGTTVTWADDNTPTAGSNVPAKIIVSVPGAESITLTGTATYHDNVIYKPEVKNPIETTVNTLPTASDQITNFSNLPSGTTAAWQANQQVPVVSNQTVPGVIIVVYPDGSTTKLSTTLTTAELDSDKYDPQASAITVDENGKLPSAESVITNASELPADTAYTWTTKPDLSTAGSTSGVITVTYPDGSTDTVTVPVTVIEDIDADQYKSAANSSASEAASYASQASSAASATDSYSTAASESSSVAGSGASAAQSTADSLASLASEDPTNSAVASAASVASSAASEASSAALVASSAASEASSAAHDASSAKSDALSADAVASSAAHDASSYASAANSAESAGDYSAAQSAASQASSAASVASSAASDAKSAAYRAISDEAVASSAANRASSAASVASSAASEASQAASEAESAASD
ncbi:Rib/alpha-like domain-containing protein, partial [Limosilactobacillus reuteri]|uniref:Rib/alpha-like domain-containing protein n=1 Tax=Limosilactobacillus reuteri TaxID=1598 RepID=UPI003D7753E1